MSTFAKGGGKDIHKEDVTIQKAEKKFRRLSKSNHGIGQLPLSPSLVHQKSIEQGYYYYKYFLFCFSKNY